MRSIGEPGVAWAGNIGRRSGLATYGRGSAAYKYHQVCTNYSSAGRSAIYLLLPQVSDTDLTAIRIPREITVITMAAMDPSKIPLAPNPSGAPPNFENPPSLHDTKTGISIALIIIGAVFLAFRLGTNLKLHRKLCLDDCKLYSMVHSFFSDSCSVSTLCHG